MKRDKSLSWRRVEASSLDLTGLRAAVIGGTGGIGRAISRLLAVRGASVIVVGQTFRDTNVPRIEFIGADLSLMQEATRIGAELPAESLDLVLMTAGIMPGPRREETAEGIERDMAVSYLSRLVILREVGPRLGTSRSAALMKPRVFIMGFPGFGQTGRPDDLDSERSYSRWAAQMNTIAGNEVLVLDAVKRYPNADVFGLNPWFVRTDIRSNLFGKGSPLLKLIEGAISFMTISPDTYAERIVPLLVSPDVEGHSGAMFNNKGEAIRPSPKLTDPTYRDAFLAASAALALRGSSPA